MSSTNRVVHAVLEGIEYKLVNDINECNGCDLIPDKNKRCIINNHSLTISQGKAIKECVNSFFQNWKKTGNKVKTKR
jgi:hypothetical protein